MIARDWILDTLAELELWYWPIFLWEVYWLDRYMKARRAEHHSGLIGYGVTRQGRIHITLQAFGDEPSPHAWTAFAPRAPWKRLAPAASFASFDTEAGPTCDPGSVTQDFQSERQLQLAGPTLRPP